MKRLANHWGTEFLLKECFGNLYFYHHRQANKQPDSTSPRLTKRGPHHDASLPDTREGDDQSDNDAQDEARRAAAHKAAAYRSAERKAGKRKATAQDADERSSHKADDGPPCNDGETELEDLPDDTRKAIQRDEIGVPCRFFFSLPRHSNICSQPRQSFLPPRQQQPTALTLGTPRIRYDVVDDMLVR